MIMMDAVEDGRLDTEFDQMLVEMRPHVLRLSHKSERQKCAVWIKKFCEPPAPGMMGRKNRNAYTHLMVHMLKKGVLEGPFTEKPEPGILPTLPSYMSIYFDDMKDADDAQNRVPDWVAGELGSDVSSMPPLDSIDSPGMRFQAAQRRFTAAAENPIPVDFTKRKTYYPRDVRERSTSPPNNGNQERKRHPSYDQEWPNGSSYSTLLTTGGNSLFKDESTLPRGQGGREAEMQKKMLEAKFQEDKLRLQQKHDSNVQKILDRKNMELEELKRHYRTKSKEQEEVTTKLERKLSHTQKELTATKEAREQETSDLKKLLEESGSNRQQELDRKISDIQSQYEEEKFGLQKQHTKNIQELLEDTNTRLTKMESEYNQQMDATSAVIRELEARVQQLGSEADNLTKIRNQLEREKIELEGHVDRLQADNMAHQDKCIQLEKDYKRQKEDYETELRTSKNKYEASIDYMKQEQSLTTAKTRNMQQEFDQLELDYQKKLRKMEQTVREKEDDLSRVLENQKHQSVQSEQALDDFKSQVERNSSKMYSDMKSQMEKVEQDLYRSKQLREKQAKDAQRSLEEEHHRHSKLLAENQLHHDQEKAGMLRDFHVEKEVWYSEKEQEVESLKETIRADMTTLEHRSREKQEKDVRTMSELERQIHTLKDELVQANSLRKQQLMELGLLREDEKQRLDRDHDIMISKLRSELDQQKFSAEKKHSSDMEEMIEKTNSRLKDIEKEYSTRAEKSNETIMEQQHTIKEIKNTMNRQQEEAELEITTTNIRLEEEKRKLKQRHASSVMTLQQEFETQKSRSRQLERQLHMQEQDYEEKMTQIRGQYEDKMHGLISASVRQELEDTISSLKQQIGLLQQRACVLQEDLDQHSSCSDRYAPSSDRYAPSTASLQQQLLATQFGDSINTMTSSIKSNA